MGKYSYVKSDRSRDPCQVIKNYLADCRMSPRQFFDKWYSLYSDDAYEDFLKELNYWENYNDAMRKSFRELKQFYFERMP